MGTGNDYIRNYGTATDFLDMERQLTGTSVSSDLIRYDAEYNGVTTSGYCANMFNIGFDCNVVDMTARVKNWPLVGGTSGVSDIRSDNTDKKEGSGSEYLLS